MSNNNYFFIDGSSLLADISRYNKDNKSTKKLCIEQFVAYFMWNGIFQGKQKEYLWLHGGSYKRIIFYFTKLEHRVEKLIIHHDITKGSWWDISFKYCWKKLKKSNDVDNWLLDQNPPPYILDRLNKSEKWVDITIATDIMFFAGQWKLDRAFLYTNDSDFIPLCERVKDLGCNISLIRLQNERTNNELLQSVDTFSYIDQISILQILVDETPI